MNHLHTTQKKGFTLVETMVAISILMLAILGPLSIASAGLRNSAYARDQITAYYLAQEAIEYVRDIRDDNYFQNNRGLGNTWLEGLDDCIVTGAGDHGCALDSLEWFDGGMSILDCNADNAAGEKCPNRQMYITPEGYYTYDSTGPGNTRARYKRIIMITPVSPNEVTITAYMSWNTGGGVEKTFELSENLFNLYNN